MAGGGTGSAGSGCSSRAAGPDPAGWGALWAKGWHGLAGAPWERAELSVDEGRRQESWKEAEKELALVKQ